MACFVGFAFENGQDGLYVCPPNNGDGDPISEKDAENEKYSPVLQSWKDREFNGMRKGSRIVEVSSTEIIWVHEKQEGVGNNVVKQNHEMTKSDADDFKNAVQKWKRFIRGVHPCENPECHQTSRNQGKWICYPRDGSRLMACENTLASGSVCGMMPSQTVLDKFQVQNTAQLHVEFLTFKEMEVEVDPELELERLRKKEEERKRKEEEERQRKEEEERTEKMKTIPGAIETGDTVVIGGEAPANVFKQVNGQVDPNALPWDPSWVGQKAQVMAACSANPNDIFWVNVSSSPEGEFIYVPTKVLQRVKAGGSTTTEVTKVGSQKHI